MNIICNVLSVVFSLFSLTMVAPFLNVLFSQESKYEKMPLTFSIKSIFSNFNYYINDYIQVHGKIEALTLICSFVIVLFFLKNLFRYLGMFFMAPIRIGIV